MFNPVTEEAIRSVPGIAGIDLDKLPQLLAQIYTRIVGFQASSTTGEIDFWRDNLEEEYKELQKISFVLELKLIVEKDQRIAENTAFVAATCREMMAMVERESSSLTLHTIPSALVASLLYMLSRNFPDAIEMLKHVRKDDMTSAQATFVSSLVSLLDNKLNKLKRIPTNPQYDNRVFADFDEYAESLMWNELTKGIKNIGKHLTGKAEDEVDHFELVKNLSSEKFDVLDATDVYTSTYKIASLLSKIGEIFKQHATINIPAPIGSDADSWHNSLLRFTLRRSYIWQNHIDAIKNHGILNPGISSVITFPTGAGKSTLSELKVISALLAGKNVLILVPTHALESQMKRNMVHVTDAIADEFSNIDGEFTSFGDEEETQVKVMTPERCLSLIGVKPEFLDNVGLVVFDEFHLISGDHQDNRAVDSMLCVLELFSRIPQADYMFLSAMVGNGNEVAGWIETATGHTCVALDNKWKPTCQLQGCVIYEESEIKKLRKIINDNKHWVKEKKGFSLKAKYCKTLLAKPYGLFSLRAKWNIEGKDYHIAPILDNNVLLGGTNAYLTANANKVATSLSLKYSLLNKKVIVFVTQVSYAYSIAKNLSEILGVNKLGVLHNSEKYQKLIEQIALELGGFSYSLINYCDVASVHTSDLLAEERYLSERYFEEERGSNIMVATPTISQGINLPADVVIMAGISRYDAVDQKQRKIETHSIMNALGRAGRAGFCTHGVSIVIPSEILSYTTEKDNHIIVNNKTFPLIEEVFSKGDNCLTVQDPFESILNAGNENEVEYMSRNAVLYRLSSREDETRAKLSKSFYAYKSSKDADALNVFNSRLNHFIANLPNNVAMEANVHLKEISAKTGYSMDDITCLENQLDIERIERFCGITVLEILKEFQQLFTATPAILYKYLPEESKKLFRDCFGCAEEQAFTADMVEKFFYIIDKYIAGASLYVLECELVDDIKNFLPNARRLVNKVIPSFSYVCGVMIMLVRYHLLALGYNEEGMGKNLTAFASCVKEGVTSYEMLVFKHKNYLMRVAAHQKIER